MIVSRNQAGRVLAATLIAIVVGCFTACGSRAVSPVSTTTGALTGADGGAAPAPDPVPCTASSYAVVANTGNLMINAGTVIDSYRSASGAYGGSNVGSNAIVQAATSITNNGGTVNGAQRQNSPAGLAIVPVPAGVTKLPLGSASPGSLNINTAAGSITLAPGDYVAANITVNFPGAINISPAGRVRIWVTGTLNLGGNENLNGVPSNLAFLVTSSGWVNVNSGGALYGMIYAPTSGVNVNSSIFGSVIGGSVSVLNSGAAVHFDQSSACPRASATHGPAGTDRLPAPPTQLGCYVGTLAGWVQVGCTDPKAIFPDFQAFAVGTNDGLHSFTTAQGAVPLVYGQVEVTVESVASEASGTRPNLWSVQTNTNLFVCNGGTHSCGVQFVVATNAGGTEGASAICVSNNDLSTSPQTYAVTCVGADGQNYTSNSIWAKQTVTRAGPLQPFDFANVAGFAFTSDSQARLAIVAQMSWVTGQDAVPATQTDLPNRIPGLYAVVAPDTYGLAGRWTDVSGSILGMENGMQATFTNAQVLTRVAASSCPGDVSASGPTCPGVPVFPPNNVRYSTALLNTRESNNLTLIQTPTVTFPNANLAVMDMLASTNVPASSATATCLPSAPNHLFIKDNEGDIGGVPSNVGGVPFWDSPDIFVVPETADGPTVDSVAPGVALVAGQPYKVYLRVHNDYGCTPVKGPISVFIDGADPNVGFAHWSKITDGADQGQYTTFGTSSDTLVPPYGRAIIGPFPWMPDGSGHKCLLAAIAAGSETRPQASALPPVLPPAFSSNQIAQRNLQIGSSCTYSITNSQSSSANLLLGISVTPATPTPGSSGGPAISVSFGDPGGVWAAEWTGLPGLSVTSDNTTTTVVLSSSYVELTSVPLAGGQSPSATIDILPATGAQPPSVSVTSILTDPQTGKILQENGGTCASTGETIILH